ncbi:hypothetical protein HZS_3275 [Henneguya salminicola]|nr:hypothetical protein HZS_3275 [Henneguya salminicola]
MDSILDSQPSIWAEKPKEYIEYLIVDSKKASFHDIRKEYKEKIHKNDFKKICLLNYAELDQLQNEKLFCFRGYVNHKKITKYLPEELKIKRNETDTTVRSSICASVLYQDLEMEEMPDCNLIERQEFCISNIEHENEWVINELRKNFHVQQSEVTVQSVGVYVYDRMESLQLEYFLEIYGLLEIPREQAGINCCDMPPLILHSLYCRILRSPSPYNYFFENTFCFVDMRSKLINALTAVFLGDSLLAEYCLLCLFSKLSYHMPPSYILGKLTLNVLLDIKNKEENDELINRLNTFLKSIMSHSALFRLNKSSTDKRIDFQTNTIDYIGTFLPSNGIKTVSNVGTVVIIDETSFVEQENKMFPYLELLENMDGRRHHSGIWDFSRYSSDFYTNIANAHFLWTPNKDFTSCPLSDFPFEYIRQYISIVDKIKFKIDDYFIEIIQDFYESDSNRIEYGLNSDCFHIILTLVRILTRSFGSKTITESLWHHLLHIESQRLDRENQADAD